VLVRGGVNLHRSLLFLAATRKTSTSQSQVGDGRCEVTFIAEYSSSSNVRRSRDVRKVCVRVGGYSHLDVLRWRLLDTKKAVSSTALHLAAAGRPTALSTYQRGTRPVPEPPLQLGNRHPPRTQLIGRRESCDPPDYLKKPWSVSEPLPRAQRALDHPPRAAAPLSSTPPHSPTARLGLLGGQAETPHSCQALCRFSSRARARARAAAAVGLGDTRVRPLSCWALLARGTNRNPGTAPRPPRPRPRFLVSIPSAAGPRPKQKPTNLFLLPLPSPRAPPNPKSRFSGVSLSSSRAICNFLAMSYPLVPA
jgi:hypothetical protein